MASFWTYSVVMAAPFWAENMYVFLVVLLNSSLTLISMIHFLTPWTEYTHTTRLAHALANALPLIETGR